MLKHNGNVILYCILKISTADVDVSRHMNNEWSMESSVFYVIVLHVDDSKILNVYNEIH